MKRQSLVGMLALVLALVFGALMMNGTALAHHPTRLITFTYQKISTIRPGEVWQDAAGLHIRNRVDVGVLIGDLEGETRVVFNADLAPFPTRSAIEPSPSFSEGTAYGTIEIFSNQPDLVTPSWTGKWTYQIHEGRVVGGSMEAYSLDGLWTLQVESVTQEKEGVLVHTGTIDHSLICPDVGCEPDPTLLEQ